MYNLRYHIASLVSVFLALALGLVLGGLAVGRGMLDRQEGALVEGLQKEFAQLRDENRDLAGENELMRDLSDELVGSWSENRLQGRSVLLVASAGMADGVVDAREAVEGAGGTVAVVTMLKPGLGRDDEQSRGIVASLAPDPTQPEQSIAASLVAEWGMAGERPLTAALVDAGLLSIDGFEDERPFDAVVSLAAPEGKSDPAALSILKAFQSSQGVAVGAQTVAADTGVASAAADAGLSAVDTLGTSVGRFTLVALLSGADPGYYGRGPSAERPFPEVPAE